MSRKCLLYGCENKATGVIHWYEGIWLKSPVYCNQHMHTQVDRLQHKEIVGQHAVSETCKHCPAAGSVQESQAEGENGGE